MDGCGPAPPAAGPVLAPLRPQTVRIPSLPTGGVRPYPHSVLVANNALLRSALLLTPLAFAACDCSGDGSLDEVLAQIEVSPQRLDFGDVALGDSVEQILTLKNVGGAPLDVSKIELSDATGGYSLPNARISPIVQAGRTDLRVVFLPVVLGDAPATLTLTSNDPDSPTVVQISGRGVRRGFEALPEGGLCNNEPDSVSFGQGVIGTPVERRIQLKATGSVPVTLRSARIANAVSGEWSLDAPAAGTVVQPGAPLFVSARFTAVDEGPETAQFVFATDAGDDVTITACARGIVAELCVRPIPVDVGQVVLRQARSATVTIENCGGREVTIERVALGASTGDDFELRGEATPPLTLIPGADIQVPIRFAPSAIGPQTALLEIDSNAVGADPRVPVTAEGVEDCSVALLPSTVDYGVVPFGQEVMRRVLITNDSRQSCTVTALAATSTAGFTIDNPPAVPFALGPGEGTVLDVRYRPPVRGRVDRGVVVARAGRGPHRTILLGNVPPQSGCQLEVAPDAINFGAVEPRIITRQSTVIRNVSGFPCTIVGTSIDGRSGPGFGDESMAAGVIGPGDTRALTVSFFPFGSGRSGAILRVETDDVDTPVFEVVVFAFVPPPGICVNPTHIPFGPQQAAATRDFRITACGAAPVTLTDLAFTAPDPEFSFLNPPQLPIVMQPGDERVITVRFEPNDAVGDTAVIAVGSDDPAAPIIPVNVTGGPEIVPPAAGRFLYFWEILDGGGDIIRMPLQGAPVPTPYWGARTGQTCAGCHSVSPDGRYLAIVGDNNFSIIIVDTQNDQRVALPFTTNQTSFVTWNPNVNTNPPYQFAYDDADIMQIASVFGGYMRQLQGANLPGVGQKMASWGPAGKIAFVRGQANGGFGFFGPTDVMLVDEIGGNAVALNGASNNNAANYYPKFSPDGRWLAYTYSQGAQGTLSAPDARVQLVRADNSGTVLPLNLLNSVSGASSFPTWAADGSFLSFSSNRAGGLGSWDIYLAPIDMATGTEGPAQNLIEANTPAFEHAAFWSP